MSSLSVTKHWFRTSTRPPSSLREIARFDAWATFSTPVSDTIDKAKRYRSFTSHRRIFARIHPKSLRRELMQNWNYVFHHHISFRGIYVIIHFLSLTNFLRCLFHVSATSNMPSAVIFTQPSSYFIWLNFALRVRSLLFRSCFSSFIGRVKNSDSCFLAEKFRFSLCYSWRVPRSDGNVTHRWPID